LIAHPQRIEQQLRDGARRLRAQYATPTLARLREAVGLRDLGMHVIATPSARQPASTALPAFKQYRETDGKFYFKLVDGERVLLQSAAFDSPKDAGMRIAALKRGQFDGVDAHVAFGEGVDADAVHAALAALAAAEAEKA
jgi:tryptophanyl-tRNA synthetase